MRLCENVKNDLEKIFAKMGEWDLNLLECATVTFHCDYGYRIDMFNGLTLLNVLVFMESNTI